MDEQSTAGTFLLDKGEKVHVAARRTFDGDLRRHFVGVVTRVSENAARVEGHTFIFDTFTGQFTKRPEVRTRLISFIDANLIVKVIPIDVEIADVRYRLSAERRLTVTDSREFAMDIEEYNFKHG